MTNGWRGSAPSASSLSAPITAQLVALAGQLGKRHAEPARRVQERRVDLRARRLEVHEQLEALVVHPQRLGVGPVDLVDHHDGLEAQRQRLARHEPGLRHRPLGRIHQQQHPVHHLEDALDLAAEVRVPRRVHDVDLGVAPAHRGVLGEDRDAPLPLQRIGIQHALHHLLAGAEDARLAQHHVHESGLPVVDMGDDGDVADVHRNRAGWEPRCRVSYGGGRQASRGSGGAQGPGLGSVRGEA